MTVSETIDVLTSDWFLNHVHAVSYSNKDGSVVVLRSAGSEGYIRLSIYDRSLSLLGVPVYVSLVARFRSCGVFHDFYASIPSSVDLACDDVSEVLAGLFNLCYTCFFVHKRLFSLSALCTLLSSCGIFGACSVSHPVFDSRSDCFVNQNTAVYLCGDFVPLDQLCYDLHTTSFDALPDSVVSTLVDMNSDIYSSCVSGTFPNNGGEE